MITKLSGYVKLSGKTIVALLYWIETKNIGKQLLSFVT